MNANKTINLTSTVDYDLFGDMTSPPGSSSFKKAKHVEERKQDRAMRNRQSAQASRERKRQYVLDLERERELLVQESGNLRARVGTLESEKSVLVTELSNLKGELENLKELVLSKAELSTISSSVSTNPLDKSKQHYHCMKVRGKGMSTGLSSLSNGTPPSVVPELGPSASQWVWRGDTDVAIANHTYHPLTHSPSASRHFLVSSDGVGDLHGPASGLSHVMRLRLRYRRRPVIHPSTSSLLRPRSPPPTLIHNNNTISSIRKSYRTSGSVLGKSILERKKWHLRRQIRKKQERLIVSRRNMNLIWDQILNGCTKMRKGNQRTFPN